VLSLDDLVENQSISPDGADVLRSIASSGRSFLVHALPRDAGKSTVVEAILAEAPPAVARKAFLGTADELASLLASATRGYLFVAEIGHHGMPGYLAGDEVPRVFELVAAGYSLASSLHADSVGEVFDVLAANGVPAAVAASIPYLVKLRMLRNPAGTHVRRVVDEVHQITPAEAGEPTAELLYRWDGETEGTHASWIEEPADRRGGGRRR
jgi:type IV secretory pathway ATPase VirB11/archaellum biosynthesis ATPase